MTLRTYRRIALYTVIALLGVMVLTIAGTLAAGVGCRGEGCGWLLLAPAFWAWLLLPPLTAALLGGFGICSGLRFSDIGLNGIFGAIPALLALRVVTVIDDLAGYPTLLFRYPLFAHLKRILKLDRLRLRGPNGARDEFHLAAAAQNLRKLAKLIPMPQPRPA